ncbi:fumarate hydratase, partial [bacterium]|nr:fumarate hydratase [bacterium]
MSDSPSVTSLFPLGNDPTPYRKLDIGGVGVDRFRGEEVVVVDPEALRALSDEGFRDINHFLRPGHLQQLASILDDPDASQNDRYVALEYLKNASIAAGGVLPMCQDTGTAIIMGKKGRRVWTPGGDEQALGQGVLDAYAKNNLRYSQLAPISMYEERNTRTNLPAQIDIAQEGEDAYKLQFMAKGGGSANKTFLFQST